MESVCVNIFYIIDAWCYLVNLRLRNGNEKGVLSQRKHANIKIHATDTLLACDRKTVRNGCSKHPLRSILYDVPNILQLQQVTGQLPRPQLCGYYGSAPSPFRRHNTHNLAAPKNAPDSLRSVANVPFVRRLLRRARRRPTRTSGSTCTSRTGTSPPLAASGGPGARPPGQVLGTTAVIYNRRAILI